MTDLRKAAEMALEALNDDPKMLGDWLDNLKTAREALRQALSQPEQEPVAQLQEEQFGRGQVLWFNKPADKTMLYTAPPKREWVGVTYDEVYEFVCTTDSYIDFAKAIEAKLKEKNT